MGKFDADLPVPNPPGCREKSGIVSELGTGGLGFGRPGPEWSEFFGRKEKMSTCLVQGNYP